MRIIFRLTLVAVASVLMVAVGFAQRSRGGHAGFVGANASAGRPFPVAPGYAPSPGLTSYAAAYTGIRPGALNSRSTSRGSGYNRGYRGGYPANRNRYYPNLPYAYFASPFYYPSFDSAPSYHSEDFGGDVPRPDQASIMAENAFGDELARLSAEVDQMRNSPGPGMPAPYPSADQEPAPSPITVVLRSGQQLTVQNYAVMNQTFWDFSHQPAKQIPISTIDVAASAKATEASGGEFPQIASATAK